MLITFSAAFAFIVYEVFLSRFFAAILDYSYVFLTIALATLGIGLGGCWAYKSLGAIYKFRSEWLGLFSIVMIISVFVMYALPYQGIWFYSAAALLPFFAGGCLLAAIIQGQHGRIRAIYFADLAGAGIGAVCSIGLMNVFNPIHTVSLLSAALFLLGFINAKHPMKWMKALYAVPFAVLCFNAIQPFSNLIPFQAYRTSPTNVFLDEKDAKVVFSEWNSFSRTDVYDAGDGQLMYITIDGGAVSPISKYTGDLKQVDYLRTTTSYLAFQDIAKERALIIGVGGGQDVLAAQMAGFRRIEAVDINSGSFRAVQALAPFSGNVFQQSGVTSIASDGRNYIRQSGNRYDLIYLSLVKKESDNGLGLALTENYIFTEEAVREYMKKLNPGGRLAFLLHDESELMKVMAAAENALKLEGIPNDQMKNRIAVIGTYQHLGHVVLGMGGSKITRPLLMVSNQPFTLSSAERLQAEAERIQQIPVHIPYVVDWYGLLSKTITAQKGSLSANRDDMPFFYNKTREVPLPLVWIAVLTIFITILLVSRTRYAYGHASYFSGIAIGFIMIETTLVQRLILPLGHPTLSFVLVLGVLLVSGGIGSLFSARRYAERTKRYGPLMWVALTALGVNAMITWYNEQMIYLPLGIRLLAAVFLLIPLGFFMGMPFPYGLNRTPQRQTAISWAVNGLMTVTGSLLSVIVSLTMGFTAAMAIGAALYGLLYVVQPKLKLQTGIG